MPKQSWHAPQASVFDEQYYDFDAQSERLTSHDQDYLQLTEGRFYGWFVSCFLGPNTSFHIEHANQAVSQSIAGAPNVYAFGIVLSDHSHFKADGMDVDIDTVFCIPPDTPFHLYSPQNATIMACVVEKSALEAKLAMAPLVLDWLNQLGQSVACLHAPILARRVRQDAFSALKACQADNNPTFENAFLGDALLSSFTATLMLEWSNSIHFLDTQNANTFGRFKNVSSQIRTYNSDELDPNAVITDLELRKRSVQYSFSNEVSLGVSSFLRHSRLHSVRRALRETSDEKTTIGDIAAQYGFWNWSHFSLKYQQLFGELPSETLQNKASPSSVPHD